MGLEIKSTKHSCVDSGEDGLIVSLEENTIGHNHASSTPTLTHDFAPPRVEHPKLLLLSPQRASAAPPPPLAPARVSFDALVGASG